MDTDESEPSSPGRQDRTPHPRVGRSNPLFTSSSSGSSDAEDNLRGPIQFPPDLLDHYYVRNSECESSTVMELSITNTERVPVVVVPSPSSWSRNQDTDAGAASPSVGSRGPTQNFKARTTFSPASTPTSSRTGPLPPPPSYASSSCYQLGCFDFCSDIPPSRRRTTSPRPYATPFSPIPITHHPAASVPLKCYKPSRNGHVAGFPTVGLAVQSPTPSSCNARSSLCVNSANTVGQSPLSDAALTEGHLQHNARSRRQRTQLPLPPRTGDAAWGGAIGDPAPAQAPVQQAAANINGSFHRRARSDGSGVAPSPGVTSTYMAIPPGAQQGSGDARLPQTHDDVNLQRNAQRLGSGRDAAGHDSGAAAGVSGTTAAHHGDAVRAAPSTQHLWSDAMATWTTELQSELRSLEHGLHMAAHPQSPPLRLDPEPRRRLSELNGPWQRVADSNSTADASRMSSDRDANVDAGSDVGCGSSDSVGVRASSRTGIYDITTIVRQDGSVDTVVHTNGRPDTGRRVARTIGSRSPRSLSRSMPVSPTDGSPRTRSCRESACGCDKSLALPSSPLHTLQQTGIDASDLGFGRGSLVSELAAAAGIPVGSSASPTGNSVTTYMDGDWMGNAVSATTAVALDGAQPQRIPTAREAKEDTCPLHAEQPLLQSEEEQQPQADEVFAAVAPTYSLVANPLFRSLGGLHESFADGGADPAPQRHGDNSASSPVGKDVTAMDAAAGTHTPFNSNTRRPMLRLGGVRGSSSGGGSRDGFAEMPAPGVESCAISISASSEQGKPKLEPDLFSLPLPSAVSLEAMHVASHTDGNSSRCSSRQLSPNRVLGGADSCVCAGLANSCSGGGGRGSLILSPTRSSPSAEDLRVLDLTCLQQHQPHDEQELDGCAAASPISEVMPLSGWPDQSEPRATRRSHSPPPAVMEMIVTDLQLQGADMMAAARMIQSKADEMINEAAKIHRRSIEMEAAALETREQSRILMAEGINTKLKGEAFLNEARKMQLQGADLMAAVARDQEEASEADVGAEATPQNWPKADQAPGVSPISTAAHEQPARGSSAEELTAATPSSDVDSMGRGVVQGSAVVPPSISAAPLIAMRDLSRQLEAASATPSAPLPMAPVAVAYVSLQDEPASAAMMGFDLISDDGHSKRAGGGLPTRGSAEYFKGFGMQVSEVPSASIDAPASASSVASEDAEEQKEFVWQGWAALQNTAAVAPQEADDPEEGEQQWGPHLAAQEENRFEEDTVQAELMTESGWPLNAHAGAPGVEARSPSQLSLSTAAFGSLDVSVVMVASPVEVAAAEVEVTSVATADAAAVQTLAAADAAAVSFTEVAADTITGALRGEEELGSLMDLALRNSAEAMGMRAADTMRADRAEDAALERLALARTAMGAADQATDRTQSPSPASAGGAGAGHAIHVFPHGNSSPPRLTCVGTDALTSAVEGRQAQRQRRRQTPWVPRVRGRLSVHSQAQPQDGGATSEEESDAEQLQTPTCAAVPSEAATTMAPGTGDASSSAVAATGLVTTRRYAEVAAAAATAPSGASAGVGYGLTDAAEEGSASEPFTPATGAPCGHADATTPVSAQMVSQRSAGPSGTGKLSAGADVSPVASPSGCAFGVSRTRVGSRDGALASAAAISKGRAVAAAATVTSDTPAPVSNPPSEAAWSTVTPPRGRRKRTGPAPASGETPAAVREGGIAGCQQGDDVGSSATAPADLGTEAQSRPHPTEQPRSSISPRRSSRGAARKGNATSSTSAPLSAAGTAAPQDAAGKWSPGRGGANVGSFPLAVAHPDSAISSDDDEEETGGGGSWLAFWTGLLASAGLVCASALHLSANNPAPAALSHLRPSSGADQLALASYGLFSLDGMENLPNGSAWPDPWSPRCRIGAAHVGARCEVPVLAPRIPGSGAEAVTPVNEPQAVILDSRRPALETESEAGAEDGSGADLGTGNGVGNDDAGSDGVGGQSSGGSGARELEAEQAEVAGGAAVAAALRAHPQYVGSAVPSFLYDNPRDVTARVEAELAGNVVPQSRRWWVRLLHEPSAAPTVLPQGVRAGERPQVEELRVPDVSGGDVLPLHQAQGEPGNAVSAVLPLDEVLRTAAIATGAVRTPLAEDSGDAPRGAGLQLEAVVDTVNAAAAQSGATPEHAQTEELGEEELSAAATPHLIMSDRAPNALATSPLDGTGSAFSRAASATTPPSATATQPGRRSTGSYVRWVGIGLSATVAATATALLWVGRRRRSRLQPRNSWMAQWKSVWDVGPIASVRRIPRGPDDGADPAGPGPSHGAAPGGYGQPHAGGQDGGYDVYGAYHGFASEHADGLGDDGGAAFGPLGMPGNLGVPEPIEYDGAYFNQHMEQQQQQHGQSYSPRRYLRDVEPDASLLDCFYLRSNRLVPRGSPRSPRSPRQAGAHAEVGGGLGAEEAGNDQQGWGYRWLRNRTVFSFNQQELSPEARRLMADMPQ